MGKFSICLFYNKFIFRQDVEQVPKVLKAVNEY